MDKVIPTNGTSAEDIKYANTVKKVYIDGVDVSGCEFYQIEANQLYPNAQYCGSMRNTFCENEPDCYYKQLKRLERQYEDVLKLAKENADSNEYCLQELEQENERLKEENKKLKYYLNKIREDELYSMDVEWDEYITECTSTEYTNVITFVELALGERDE